MKKLFTLLVVITLFISCSSDDDSGSIESRTTLTSYQEPFFSYDAPKSEIITRYGDSYSTSSNQFSLGYNMEYDTENSGVVKYYFVLDNQELLYETEVLFFPGRENVQVIKDYLARKYEFISESTNIGLYVGNYESETVRVKLSYFDGEYTGTTITYSSNSF